MTHLLLESLWLTLGVAACGFVALLFIGQRMEPRRRGWMWLGWLATVAACYALQRGVLTTREEIRAALDRLVRAVADEDAAAIGAAFDGAYQHDGMNHAELTAWIKRALQEFDVYDTSIARCDVDVNGDSARMDLRASATVRYQGVPFGRPRGVWEIDWRRTSDGWRIARLTPRQMEDRAVSSLRELRP